MSPAHRAWLRALESVAVMQRDPGLTLPGLVDELAARYGAAPALLGTGGDMSYEDLAKRVNQVARWAAATHPRTTIGLLMPNGTDYVAIWLGLTRAGCVVALLNPQLAGDALRHAVQAASCRAVIAEPGLVPDLGDVPLLETSLLQTPSAEARRRVPSRTSPRMNTREPVRLTTCGRISIQSPRRPTSMNFISS